MPVAKAWGVSTNRGKLLPVAWPTLKDACCNSVYDEPVSGFCRVEIRDAKNARTERAVIKATLDWADGKAGHHNVLDAVIEYRKAKKVRK